MLRLKKSYIIFSIILILILVLNPIFIKSIYAENVNKENVDGEDVYDTLMFDENDLEVSAVPVKEPTVSSRAAVVIDRKTGRVLYEKNSKDIRKQASTTKIMTAIVVLENTPDLYKTVTVSKKAASIGGSVLGLRTNDKITINDLLYGLMLKSRK